MSDTVYVITLTAVCFLAAILSLAMSKAANGRLMGVCAVVSIALTSLSSFALGLHPSIQGALIAAIYLLLYYAIFLGVFFRRMVANTALNFRQALSLDLDVLLCTLDPSIQYPEETVRIADIAEFCRYGSGAEYLILKIPGFFFSFPNQTFQPFHIAVLILEVFQFDLT